MVPSAGGVHEKGTLSLNDVFNSIRGKPNFRKVGAIAVFVGVVRGETPGGKAVKKLELEAYEDKANEVLRSICDDLQERKGVTDVRIHHLLGQFDVGEDLVYIVVAGSHRHNVFPILEEAVERYKVEVPIFKKEHLISEGSTTKSRWVGEHKHITDKRTRPKIS